MQPTLRRISWNYSLVQALYFPALCPIISFASVYLLSKGFSNGQYGLLMGLANGLVVLLQPTLASLADRSKRFNLSRIILTTLGVTAVALIGLIFCGDNLILIGFLYLLGAAGTWVVIPLINALCVWFINRGIPVNFGLCRGVGSLSFAVMSWVLGRLVAETSSDILIYIGLLFTLLTGVSVYTMRVSKYTAASEECTKPEAAVGGGSFFRRYRLFCVGMVGWALIFLFFRVLYSYIYQIICSIGGDSASLGICMSFGSVAEMIAFMSCNWIRRHVSDKLLMRISALAFVAQSVIALFAPNVTVFILSVGLQLFSSGIYFSTSVYYVNTVMSDGDKNKGQAMMIIVSAIAAIFACFLGGWLLSVGTVKTLLTVSLAIAAIGAAIVLLTTRGDRATTSKPLVQGHNRG